MDDTTVYLVDDEPSVLKAISRLLRSEGLNVCAFESPSDFLASYDPESLGCVVLDMAMPGLDGLEIQQKLVEGGASLPIVFLTGRGDVPASVKAMKQGAVDFLTKPVDEADLLAAVRAGIEKVRSTRQAFTERTEIEKRLSRLTPRERQVLDQVVAGRLNKQIAADLGTVEKTIKVHRAHVMEKMKVRSVAELVQLAARVGVQSAMSCHA